MYMSISLMILIHQDGCKSYIGCFQRLHRVIRKIYKTLQSWYRDGSSGALNHSILLYLLTSPTNKLPFFSDSSMLPLETRIVSLAIAKPFLQHSHCLLFGSLFHLWKTFSSIRKNFSSFSHWLSELWRGQGTRVYKPNWWVYVSSLLLVLQN